MSLPLTHAGLSAPGISAALDLKFASTLSLTSSSGITPSYSRASTGTYFNSSGVLTSAAINAPRFDHTYNGTSWISRGLLVEEQRTNLQLASSDLGNGSYWSNLNMSISANSGSAPDGTATADFLVPSAGTGTKYIYSNPTPYTKTAGANNAVSIFAKSSDFQYITIQALDNGSGAYIHAGFDLLNGIVGSSATGGGATFVSSSIQNVGNGWYRCVIVGSSSGTQGRIAIGVGGNATLTSTGDGVKGAFIWGVQAEDNVSFPTSYIPTTTASVTRSADVCQITGSDFSSFWNASEGSFAVEYDSLPPSGLASWYGYPFQASNGGSTHRMMVGNDSQNNQQLWLVQDSVGQSIISSGSFFSNAGGKLSCCYKINDLAMSVNGSAVVTDLSQGISSLINQIRIGDANDGATNRNINGHISRLRYFNKRLTDKQLEDLCRPEEQLKLDLKFSENLSLTPVVGPTPSFSRASTGMYFNSSGVLTSAAINAPRFDHTYDGTSWISKGLLIEEQRTNLAQRSEDFANAYWVKSNATISGNQAVSPDGNNTADLFYGPSSGSVSGIYATPGGNCISIFAKASGKNWISLTETSLATSGFFNLSTGTVGTVGAGFTATIQPVGNGWYRCSLSKASAFSFFQILVCDSDNSFNFTANGTNGVLIWGAQAETGSFPTSYIPTTTTSVVRSADVCQITGAAFSGFYNQSEGSVAIEAGTFSDSSYFARAFEFTKSSTIGQPVIGLYTLNLGASGGGNYVSFVVYDSSTQALLQQEPARPFSKSAFGFRVNDFAASINGGAALTDNSGTINTGYDIMTIGGRSGSLNLLNGHISRIRYYAIRLPNRLLIAKSQ
jgi:hypothetical protein